MRCPIMRPTLLLSRWTSCWRRWSSQEFKDFHHRKLDHRGASVRPSVIDEHRLALLADAGGEDPVRHETLALEIQFWHEYLAAHAEDAPRLFQIEQQEAAGICAD